MSYRKAVADEIIGHTREKGNTMRKLFDAIIDAVVNIFEGDNNLLAIGNQEWICEDKKGNTWIIRKIENEEYKATQINNIINGKRYVHYSKSLRMLSNFIRN